MIHKQLSPAHGLVGLMGNTEKILAPLNSASKLALWSAGVQCCQSHWICAFRQACRRSGGQVANAPGVAMTRPKSNSFIGILNSSFIAVSPYFLKKEKAAARA